MNKIGKFSLIRKLPRFLGRGPIDVQAHLVKCDAGNLSITGWLYIGSDEPLEDPAHPIDTPAPSGGAILVGHGGVEGVPAHYDLVLRRLARAGWTVAAPNYRGESGSNGEVEFALGEVEDTIAWGKALCEIETVNPEKIWLFGSSHGAMVSALALGRDENFFAGGVTVAGIFDVRKWLDWLDETNHEALGDAVIIEMRGLGDAELNTRSAISVARKISAPILLIHGESDTVVPVEQTLAFENALRAGGNRNVGKLIQPASDHEFIWAPDRREAIDAWKKDHQFHY